MSVAVGQWVLGQGCYGKPMIVLRKWLVVTNAVRSEEEMGPSIAQW